MSGNWISAGVPGARSWHLLLREGHTGRGLMREEWFKRDLELAKTGLLGFTPQQGARIRAHLIGTASCPAFNECLMALRP